MHKEVTFVMFMVLEAAYQQCLDGWMDGLVRLQQIFSSMKMLCHFTLQKEEV